MGIFNTINQKSGLIGAVIAITILLFILTDLITGKGNSIFSNRNSVGEIAGQDVSYKDYSDIVEQTKQNFGGNVPENQMPQVHAQAWNNLILKYAFPKQYEKLGIEVSDEELEELVSGQNLWEGFNEVPIFKDSLTNQFSRKNYDRWKKNVLANPEGEAFFEKLKTEQIVPERLRAKYLALFNNSIYVTKEEAKRDYTSQNTKAEIKYLYVPYSAVADTLVKVSESDLKAYINKHKEEYKREARANIQYVVFQVSSSKEDSLQAKEELNALKKDFETSTDDSSFAVNNSDNGSGSGIKRLGELPEALKDNVDQLQAGQIYGPVSDGGKLKLIKVIDVINDPKDTLYYASTKHILFMTRGKSEAEKDSIKKKALSVLKELQNGASFDEAVITYSEDQGSKFTGGEYKYFPKGQMVKPFENAVFNAKGPGLVNNLVETEYGFHILKVTKAKSNTKFNLAIIEKDIIPQNGRDKAYQDALNFQTSVSDSSEFNAQVKKDSLQVQKFENLTAQSTYVNSLSNPRELIQWALIKGKEDGISPVMTIGDQYIVANLISRRDKGTAEVDEVENEVKQKVMNEKKAEIISEKLAGIKGDLQKKAESYGAGANAGSASDLTLSSGSIPGVGQEPAILGTVFGLIPGKRTIPLKGENGVAVLELVKITEAAPIADYTTYQSNLSKTSKDNIYGDIDTAIKEDADIVDNRVKFF